MLGHAYLPTPVLDRHLAEKLEHPRYVESGKYVYTGDDENEMERNRKRQFLEKAKQFVKEPVDASGPFQLMLKVWRECGERFMLLLCLNECVSHIPHPFPPPVGLCGTQDLDQCANDGPREA